MRGARLGLSLVASACAVTAVTLSGQVAPVALRPAGAPIPVPACGTTRDDTGGNRLRPLALPNGLADGEPFTFDQDPAILFADYTGTITLHNFSVVGDVATVQFVRPDQNSTSGKTETWSRTTSRSVNGQLVSVFEPTWTRADLDSTLTLYPFGFDRPFIYWGAVQVPGTSMERYVYFRVGLHGIPSSPVVRINDQVQYASDVVNIVVPTFDDARVVYGANGFDVTSASQLFYKYFDDAYDVLAFTPEAVPVANFGAYHSNVRNTVAGINISTFDQSKLLGSNGVLQGIEVYGGANATRYEDTEHEMAHQWLSNFDWTKIAGISRAGWSPSSHSPLWTGGETLIGAVLLGTRRVASGSTYAIEQTPVPPHYHPIELYAMGLLTADQVPDFAVFSDQGQFDASTAAEPKLGTGVSGDTKKVSVTDVIRVHGARQGPAIRSAWRRATVVVSKSQLASQQEMDYWNFFAQRLGDRNHASRPNYDNFVSFRRATNGAVELSTAIAPTGRAPLAQTMDIDTPSFGATDWRGVTFDSPVPSRIAVGQTVTLTGRVTASDRSDFNGIQLGFWAPNASSPINFPSAVSSSGGFTLSIRFTDAQKGPYFVGDYLYWPNSGGQYPRSGITTITVE